MDNELKIFGRTILATTDHLKNLETVNATVYNNNGQFNLKGLSVNAPQSVTIFTKLGNAFKAYNSNLTKSIPLQNAYIKAVGNQNGTLGSYLASLNGAEATMGGYIKSLIGAKAATIGLQIASALLNATISFGLSFALSALMKLVDDYIHRVEKIKEAAVEAKNSINSIRYDLKSQSDIINEVKDRYAELSQGVENLGQANQSRGKLSNDDYTEFLNLSNQLAETFPQLTKGYDDNGNAILNLSGSVNILSLVHLKIYLVCNKELLNKKFLIKCLMYGAVIRLS